MQEIITKITEVETKIVDKLDDFYGSFSKHEELEMKLFDQNKIRIDRLSDTTDAMKKEYRTKFVKIERNMKIFGVMMFSAYIVSIIIQLF